jgi:hypothetical protein
MNFYKGKGLGVLLDLNSVFDTPRGDYMLDSALDAWRVSIEDDIRSIPKFDLVQ